jgi:soluble lytic murein transglycosylase
MPPLFAQETDLGPYREYQQLQQIIRNGDLPQARAFVEDQLQYTHPFLMRKMRLDLAEAFYRHHDFTAAKYWANRVLSDGPNDVFTPRAYRLFVLMAMENRESQTALTTYGKMISQYPESDLSLALFKSMQKLFGRSFELADCFSGADPFYTYLTGLLAHQKNELLLTQSRYFLRAYPRDPRIGHIYYGMGLSFFSQGHFRDAVRAFELSTTREKDPKWLSRAYFMGAVSALHGQNPLAVIWLDKVIDYAQGTAMESAAYYWLCKYYQATHNSAKLAQTEAAFRTQWGNSPEWAQLIFEKEWDALRLEAKQGVPMAIIEPHFAKALGQPLLAQKLRGFYAQQGDTLPQGILNYPLHFHTLSLLKVAVSADESLPESIRALDHKLATLHQMGLGQVADEEVRSLKGQQPDTPKGLSLRYWYGTLVAKFTTWIEQGHPILPAIDLELNQAQRWPIPKFLLHLLYPRPYWNWITHYAKVFHVDPYLVLAIMREESNFNPTAVSRVKARGLMQIMPKTGHDVAFRLGKRWTGPDSLDDPKTNIELGTYYIAWLRRQLKGPLYTTIAAYNAGPLVTAGWIKSKKYDSAQAFIDAIPYTETQVYIHKVMSSYMIYKLLYEGKDPN